MHRVLALFDFDGTITSKDTLFDIARFSTSGFIYWFKIGLLLPSFIFMKLSILSKQKGKEKFLKMFFSQMKENDFQNLCNEYCQKRLPQIIRPLALKKIKELKKNGTDIYVVSASPKNWIEPWAHPMGICVLSTNLEMSNSKILGIIAGKNCNGPEKVNRIMENIDLNLYDSILAFGDTAGDLPMFELATETYYKPFT